MPQPMPTNQPKSSYYSKATLNWNEQEYDIPDDEQIEEWMLDSVCETPDGECVEPDHPDSWLSLLGLI